MARNNGNPLDVGDFPPRLESLAGLAGGKTQLSQWATG